MAEELMRADPVDMGWAALSSGDWERARTAFEDSLAEGETPEALEGMGWVGHMLDEDPLTFDVRERAYRLYLERGDKGSAARIAAWLAADCLLFRGEPAVANGWLQRAHSLIDGLEPGIDHGWLAIHEGHIAVALDEDTVKARRLAVRAVELGRAFGAPELEMLGLGLEGASSGERRRVGGRHAPPR
jgi:LuxR family maltose regulon positive regulatory protein